MKATNFTKRTGIAVAVCLASIAIFAVSCGGNAKKKAADGATETAQTETKAAPAKAKGGTLTVSNLTGDEASITVYNVSTAFSDWSAFNAAGGEPASDKTIAVSASASDPMMSFQPSASPIALYDYNNNFSDKVFTRSGTFLVQVSVKSDYESRYFSQVTFKDGSATVDWNKGFGPAHDPE
jgi:hypothetical protein